MKHKVALLFSTAVLVVAGLTGCNRPRTVIDSAIKNAFQHTEEKVDEYNDVFSESSHAVEHALQIMNAPTIKNAASDDYNTSITDAKLFEFLAAEFFGVYVYSCVNYCLQNKYEEYGLEFNDLIYGDVTNMVDPHGKEALDKYHATNRFYYEMAQDGNDLTFKCDWDLTPSVKELAEVPDFMGTIYVNGRIVRDDDLTITAFNLTSFANYRVSSRRACLTTSRFDFVNKKLYVLDASFRDTSEGNATGKEIIEKYNAGELDYETFKSYKFERLLVGSANLTDDYRDVDYEGYFWDSTAKENENVIFDKNGVDEEIYKEMYTEAYSNLFTFAVRNVGEELDRENRIKVDFLEDSLGYGIAKSKIYVGTNDQVDYVFIEKEKLLSEIDKYLEKSTDERANELMGTLREQISNIRDDKYLTYFSNDKYEFDANPASPYRYSTYNCTDFYYQFLDKNNDTRLVIRTLNGEFTDVAFKKAHDQGFYKKYSEPSTYRTETIASYVEEEDGSVVLYETINSYTKCREKECKEEYIWKTVKNTYLGTFDKDNPVFAYAKEYKVKNVAFYGFLTSTQTYRYNYEQYDLVNVINEEFKYEYSSKYNVYYPVSALRKSIDSIYYGGNDYERLNIDGTYEITFEEEDDTTTIKCYYKPYIDEVMWRPQFEDSARLIDSTIVVKRNERYNYDIMLSFESIGGTTSPYEETDDYVLNKQKVSVNAHLEYTDFEDPDRPYPYVSKQTFDVNYDDVDKLSGDVTLAYEKSEDIYDWFKATESGYYKSTNGSDIEISPNTGWRLDKYDELNIPLYNSFDIIYPTKNPRCNVWSDYGFVDALLESVVRSYIENDMPERTVDGTESIEA